MSDLARRQARFVAHLRGQDPAFGEEIPDGPRAARSVLMGVYTHAYGARLQEALRSNYPALHQVLGDDTFARAAQDYVALTPSRHFSIRWFGHTFPDFLQRHAPWSADPWLCEFALFEWTLGLCLDGPDGEPTGFETLAALPPAAWPAARFRLVPTVRRLTLGFSVPQTWAAVTAGTEPVPRPQAVDPPVHWLIWRRDLVTLYRSLSLEETACLALIADGGPFEALCERTAAVHGPDQAPVFAAGYLRQWVDDGILTLITDGA